MVRQVYMHRNKLLGLFETKETQKQLISSSWIIHLVSQSVHSHEQELWLKTLVALSDRTGTVIEERGGGTKY